MSDSFTIPWIIACQASLSMGFSRQEYRSGLAVSFSRDVPDPGVELVYPALAGGFFTTDIPGKNKLSRRNPLVLP